MALVQSFFGSVHFYHQTTFLRILYNDDRNNLIYLKQFVCHLLPKHSLSGLNFAGPGEVEGRPDDPIRILLFFLIEER